MPYVEYTSNVEEEVTQNVPTEKAAVVTITTPQQPRAVAKKSTTKRQINVDTTSSYNFTVETKPSHSIVVSKK